MAKQLEDLEIPFVDDFSSAIKSTDHVVDAIFGAYPAVSSYGFHFSNN